MCKSFDIGQCNCSHPGECFNAKWVKYTPNKAQPSLQTYEYYIPVINKPGLQPSIVKIKER